MAGDIVPQLRDTRYPGQLEMRLSAAEEIERLRRRVVVLEMVIREEVDVFACRDHANQMIVEGIQQRCHPVGRPTEGSAG